MVVYPSSEVALYTDGACYRGCGGWAFAAVCRDTIVSEFSSYATGTTNNRMELSAVISAMQWMIGASSYGNVITTDSKYCINVLNPLSKLTVNHDLVMTARSLAAICRPEFKWVKGHSGFLWNEYVDSMAVKARKLAEADLTT